MNSIPDFFSSDTIVAPATPLATSALAIIRISGPSSYKLFQPIFRGKVLKNQPANTIHFGTIMDQGRIIDEVMVSLFKAPHSFTKEDSLEITCHGSPFIIEKLLALLVKQGARPARPGEFTQRAIQHGRFDLAQAEAVADLIAAQTDMAHRVAVQQMRGHFSSTITQLRSELIQFTALLELELDFSDEDVAFAQRDRLERLLADLIKKIDPLIESFSDQNVIKKGVPVVLTGLPNAGKSTLLNNLLGEERALVSSIPGTTRDTIQDTIRLEGIDIQLIDTAGLHNAKDKLEKLGILKAEEARKKAYLHIVVADISTLPKNKLTTLKETFTLPGKPTILVGNKADIASSCAKEEAKEKGWLLISAKKERAIERLKKPIIDALKEDIDRLGQATAVVNLRHYKALKATKEALNRVEKGIKEGLDQVLLIAEIKEALHQLGSITGTISSATILDDIFGKFCIGK